MMSGKFDIGPILLGVATFMLLSACQTTDKKRTNFADLDTSNPFVVGLMVTYHDYCEHYFLDGADIPKVQALKDKYERNESYKKGYTKYRNSLAGDYTTGPNRCGEVKAFFDLAFAGKNNNKKAAKTSAGPAQKYYMVLTWENVLAKTEAITVLVRQSGGKGNAKASTLVGGKDCNAVFYYIKDGSGTWALDCTDGSKAIGTLQFKEDEPGSTGSGTDSEGNRIEFELLRELPKTET